jgi:RNA polymerase sigma factor (sigma-70 family)
MTDDATLLRRYAQTRTEDAFAELVRRHLDAVYSAALRRVGGDVHLAEDVAQQVFVALARKAAVVAQHPVLTSWLHTATRHEAANAVRQERRRKRREQEAHIMQQVLEQGEAEPDWRQLAPVLDAAIDELAEEERVAILLRFMERQAFGQIGARLSLSEDAARMRVTRALEKLRARLSRRGLVSSSAGLLILLSAESVRAAPPQLAGAIVSAATALPPGAGAFSFFMSTSKVALGVSVVAVATISMVAWMQGGRAERAESELTASQGAERRAQARLRDLAADLARAEQRVAEAERDSGELLKAIEAQRQTANRQTADAGRTTEPRSEEETERLTYERSYQQALARRRYEEGRERSRLQETALEPDGSRRLNFDKALAAAEELYAKADFQGALSTFNLALQSAPAGAASSPRATELRAALERANRPVNVKLDSNNETWVWIVGALSPRKFQSHTVRILPGNYEIVGERAGYRPVRMPLVVHPDTPLPPLSVVCWEALQK